MVILHANVECDSCGEIYEGTWTDDSLSVQDMAEPPEQPQACMSCGHEQLEVYPGWCFNSEAG